MLILAIILTILGIIVFRWYSRALNEPFYNRPLIFSKMIPVLIINLIWVFLLGGGLYSFWQFNPKIVIYIISGYAILWIVGFILGSQKQKAKKYFQIYKQLKIYRPQTSEEEILKETVKLYYKNLRWDEDRINSIVEVIFDNKDREKKGVRDLARLVFVMEEPSEGLNAYDNFEKTIKKHDKMDKAIEWAYQKVFENKEKISQRPELGEDIIKRIREAGLDPNLMSNEQLAALESFHNPNKNNWFTKMLSAASLFFGFLVFLDLISLDFTLLIFNSITALVLMYVGYIIQRRIANKKFIKASIVKWSEEQKRNENSPK
jgi:hypothetical protein